MLLLLCPLLPSALHSLNFQHGVNPKHVSWIISDFLLFFHWMVHFPFKALACCNAGEVDPGYIMATRVAILPPFRMNHHERLLSALGNDNTLTLRIWNQMFLALENHYNEHSHNTHNFRIQISKHFYFIPKYHKFYLKQRALNVSIKNH